MNWATLAEQLTQEIVGNILPFHMQYGVDQKQGGFYGRVENDGTSHPKAPKGLVQHSRYLWAFAHAFRHFQDPRYLKNATRAYEYLVQHFWDARYQGMFWRVSAKGKPVDRHKIIYGQAFAIYGLSEFSLASGDGKSREIAITLYRLLEQKAVDPRHGGYFDAFKRNWRLTEAINIDETAYPTVKSMNTHLHLLEAYTNLLRAWDALPLRQSLRMLINVLLEHIIDRPRGQMMLHFSADWRSLTNQVSYGHDIEASWLLVEAVEVLGESELLAEVQQLALNMAQVALDEGLDSDGSLRDHDQSNEKTWWVQAEAMVGFLNAYQLSGEPHFLQASIRSWQFIRETLRDRRYGEWIWGLDASGKPAPLYKAGLWKAPYHNGRACLEVIRRIQKIRQGDFTSPGQKLAPDSSP